MENSRHPFDPKIRKVGFFAPSPPPNRTQSGPPGSSPPLSNSLSPVMIPPPRHASDNLSRATIGIGISVLGGQSNHHHQGVGDGGAAADVVEVGSYNGGAESVLGGMEFSEDSGDWGVRDGDGMKKVLAMSLPSDGVRFHHDDDDEKGGAPVAKMSSQSKSKPLKEKTTKAERRAMQEAQRAAKAATKESSEKNIPVAASGGAASVKTGKIMKQPRQKKDGPPVTSTTAASEKKGGDRAPEKERKKDLPPPRLQFDDKSRVDKAKKRSVVKQTEVRNRVELFRHLPQYERGTQLPDLETKFFQLEPMHPAVYKVGLQYLAGDIVGGNARCIAMLQAFQRAFEDYSTPSEKSINRDLIAKINSYVSFLIECRPLSISMGNAIRFLKARVTKLPLDIPESEAKASICSDINRFISEKIVFADRIIVKHAVTKIRDDDVLLTYGSSSTVEMIILNARGLGKRFRVVVVDSRPKLEGQALVRRLVQNGVSCTYTHINAVSYIMHEVTRVLIGAASVLSNGTIYSRVGTACIAMVAHAFRVPVLVCCEAYKFHERVQLDSVCCNELGNPDAISKVPGKEDVSHLENLANRDDMQHLNLMYDATPSDYISAIITEYGMIPPTSVPVIIREYGGDYLFA